LLRSYFDGKKLETLVFRPVAPYYLPHRRIEAGFSIYDFPFELNYWSIFWSNLLILDALRQKPHGAPTPSSELEAAVFHEGISDRPVALLRPTKYVPQSGVAELATLFCESGYERLRVISIDSAR
jgi:hypothetical protein